MNAHPGAGILFDLLRRAVEGMNPYELAGVLFGVVSVWLTTRENVWCWPTGLVNVGLFIVVFGQAKLYADMGLQLVYVALCLYGWYEWLHGGKDHGVLRVSRTPRRLALALGGAGTAFAILLGTALRQHTDAALPFWDSATTSFSLVAQWMQTRKWLETWVVWIAVDVVYVGMYVYKHLHLTAALYVAFLVLAVLGLRSWRQSASEGG
jgi:nicotinamide mononucleotide transporter